MWSQPALIGQALAVFAAGTILLAAAYRAPWKRLLEGDAMHWWCACIVCLMLLRGMDAMPVDGLRLHLFGTTLVYALFGLPLALLAEGVAGAGLWLSGREPASDYALNFLLRGALPIAVAHAVFRIIALRPHARNFAGCLGAAFFAGACASLIAGAAAVLVGGPDVWRSLASPDLAAMLLMLSTAEAQLCVIGSVVLLACARRRDRYTSDFRTPWR